mmetsp:Transcript_67611/g.150912  ORF Transcript_67611/g.150912 Transcript_67611/m.150912 type:complete len:122 (-) Transcript_67611:455-820(-)
MHVTAHLAIDVATDVVTADDSAAHAFATASLNTARASAANAGTGDTIILNASTAFAAIRRASTCNGQREAALDICFALRLRHACISSTSCSILWCHISNTAPPKGYADSGEWDVFEDARRN